jgi:uncharacterized membrane protein (DUF106 family)
MSYLLFLIIIVPLGILAGGKLAMHVLILLSGISIAIFLYFREVNKEIAVLITLLYTFVAIVFNLAMWATYYITTNQTWLGEFFHDSILR